MRDALGYVCLILFVPAVIALVLGATRPELFVRRWSGRADEALPEAAAAPPAAAPAGPPSAPPHRSLVIAVFAGAAVALAGLTYFLLLAPTYAVTVKPPEEIVAAPGSKVPIEVANNGALAGTSTPRPPWTARRSPRSPVK